MRYDRARVSLGPHATYIVAANLAAQPGSPDLVVRRGRSRAARRAA